MVRFYSISLSEEPYSASKGVTTIVFASPRELIGEMFLDKLLSSSGILKTIAKKYMFARSKKRFLQNVKCKEIVIWTGFFTAFFVVDKINYHQSTILVHEFRPFPCSFVSIQTTVVAKTSENPKILSKSLELKTILPLQVGANLVCELR